MRVFILLLKVQPDRIRFQRAKRPTCVFMNGLDSIRILDYLDPPHLVFSRHYLIRFHFEVIPSFQPELIHNFNHLKTELVLTYIVSALKYHINMRVRALIKILINLGVLHCQEQGELFGVEYKALIDDNVIRYDPVVSCKKVLFVNYYILVPPLQQLLLH